MSSKGRIGKMESGRKAIEILAWMIEQANAGKAICLTDDWGGNSLTISLGAQMQDGSINPGSHTHVGFHDHSIDQLIDNFHSTVTGKGGLSWA